MRDGGNGVVVCTLQSEASGNDFTNDMAGVNLPGFVRSPET